MFRLSLAFGLATLLAQDSPEIERLLTELGHERIEVREKAHARLVEIGSPALAALRRILESSTGEVQARVRTIIGDLDRVEAEQARDEDMKRRTVKRCRREDREFEAAWEQQGLGKQIRSETAWFSFGGWIFKEHHALHATVRSNLRSVGLEPGPVDGGIEWDVIGAVDMDGKELPIERCGKCSPGRLLIKNTHGPFKAKVRGTHLWFNPYPLEFADPKNGDTRKVGDFTIVVDWPVLRITSRSGRTREVLKATGTRFSIEGKPGVDIGIRDEMVIGGGGGGGFRSGSNIWCGCDTPAPAVAKPAPERFRESKAECRDTVGFFERPKLDQVAKILFVFNKPIEEPIEFTVDIGK